MAAATKSPHVLDGGRIVATLEQLLARIRDRFPDSGLSRVCADLTDIARRTEASAADLGRPYVALRGAVAMVVVAVAALGGWVFHRIHIEELAGAGVLSITQALESAVNLLLLAAAGAWFLLSLETRLKRRQAHAALSELRALAHVIDMHQLTKDPTVIVGGQQPTQSSPAREMSEFELARYLDYCAEMLALIAKLAALYQRAHSDPEIGAAVNEVEGLTSDLGRKIWQKITIIGQLADH